jgi:hypothetical protein
MSWGLARYFSVEAHGRFRPSRLTVTGDTPSTSAIASIVNPPKYRSSTI